MMIVVSVVAVQSCGVLSLTVVDVADGDGSQWIPM